MVSSDCRFLHFRTEGQETELRKKRCWNRELFGRHQVEVNSLELSLVLEEPN